MSAVAADRLQDTLPGAATTRPVADVMRGGVVLCDADISAREVARAMRDRGVRTVLAIDLSSELIGIIDERAVASAWDDPDGRTAAEIMDPDPLIAAPDESVAAVAARMLQSGATSVLVAYPPPSEESGVWSEWKERGMPLGTLSVGDIVARLDELAPVIRSTQPRTASPAQRAAPWIALAGVLLAVAVVLALILAYANGTHHITNRPGL
ncbi:MAG: cyclic nucleotide-binding/CBS domain-containing protein [Candidatus Dormibacteria bacterium]